jgi:hypothetical protein
MAVITNKCKAMTLQEKLNIIHQVDANMHNKFTALLMTEFYLLYLGLFNDIVSISDYIVPNGRMINE